MKIWKYRVPFKNPVNTGAGIIEYREGLILEEENPDGTLCFGEIPPLPGFSEESLEDVEAVLDKYDFNKLLYHQGIDDVRSLFKEWGIPLYSSLIFGIESLLVEMGRITDFNKEIICNQVQSSVLVNTSVNITNDISSVVKMKAGRSSVHRDIELFNTLNADPRIEKIRVDANRLWSYEEALEFTSAIDTTNLEFIEEPFRDVTSFSRFYKKTDVLIGIDESLTLLEERKELFSDYTGAVIIKPVLDGGLVRTKKLIQRCNKNGVMPVISSIYEAGPGFSMLLEIAKICDKKIFHGFSTLNFLAKRVIKGDIEYSGNYFRTNKERQIVRDLLKRVF